MYLLLNIIECQTIGNNSGLEMTVMFKCFVKIYKIYNTYLIRSI